ncbi:LuxR C-terminal-related transcriptional regulator [Aquincola sp. J276]|uniref:helix-turn-helix transcriptional regulator n=1 Tax=Aquincola sp. J276 TaxID=2898432 RepID=UPI002151A0EA|nr:LuxR C-terminal-related transcriptional regulator [Aquincola sp. J276]MCR5868125.1 LuxR C-terminal-related transcriptional regulator [Aquincola sp. J276]
MKAKRPSQLGVINSNCASITPCFLNGLSEACMLSSPMNNKFDLLSRALSYRGELCAQEHQCDSAEQQGTAAALLSRMLEAISIFDCDCACFLSVGKDDPIHGERRYVLANCPQLDNVLQDFSQGTDCLWLHHASISVWPASDGAMRMMTERHHLFASAVRGAGIGSVLAVPAPTPRSLRRTAVFVLAAAKTGFFELIDASAAALAYGLAMAVSRLQSAILERELRSVCRLSTEEAALLRFQQDGMTSKDISKLISVPPQTIDCRFQRICAKLRAGSRQQALAIAASYGCLDAANDDMGHVEQRCV